MNKKQFSLFRTQFITLSFLVLVSCVGEKEINEYAVNNDSGKLITYIEKNRTKASKKELVDFAINASIKSNNRLVIQHLEKEFYDNYRSYYYNSWQEYYCLSIIKYFNEYDILFNDMTSLIDKYIKIDDGNKFKIPMQVMIDLSPELEGLTYIVNKLKGRLENEHASYSLKLIKRITSLKLSERLNLKHISDILTKRISFDETEKDLSAKIKQFSSEIEESEQFLDKNHIFSLYGYIVNQMGSSSGINIYEIQTGYSNTRALLYTTTTYTTRGSFTQDVINNGTTPVQVKQEFGGFTQNWPMYTGVSDEWKQKIRKEKESLQWVREELSDAKKDLVTLTKKIKKNDKAINKYIITIIKRIES